MNNERTVTIETINPRQAWEYLQKNKSTQRPAHSGRVSALKEEILRGNWVVGVSPIRFDTNGDLCDGQHRLRACIEANMPIQVEVIRNEDPRVFDLIDTGLSRSPRDLCHMAGMRTRGISSAARFHITLSAEDVGDAITRGERVEPYKIRDHAVNHPELSEALHNPLVGKAGRLLGSLGIMAAFYTVAQERHGKEMVDTFLKRIVYTEGDPEQAGCVLRERLDRMRQQGKKLTSRDKMRILVHLWSYHKKDRLLSKFNIPTRETRLPNI